MKRVALLGSTGSIGTQTLDILRRYPDDFKVVSLVAYSNAAKLHEQANEFKPEYAALISEKGEECLIQAVSDCDLVVVATRGICAIDAVLHCLQHGIDVALANKETLVCAGELIFNELRKSNSKLIPVDSEHFAISQCLVGRNAQDVKKLLLTASGGPFRDYGKAALAGVTPEQALRHPNWSMGVKITVDSATMMNKALEVIEAKWLFSVPVDKIEILVHPQSVVHSMVEFVDNSVMAQMAVPDMHIPIQTALLGGVGRQVTPAIDFAELSTLTFEACDFDRFPCAKLGYEIFQYPPLAATVMNAANDVCVEKFLQGNLSFDNFYNTIVNAVEHFALEIKDVSLTVSNIKRYAQCAQAYTIKLLDGVTC